LDLVEGLIDAPVDANRLVLDPLDEDHAVEFAHDADRLRYTVTYHFSYILPEKLAPPEGWQWTAS
jgi:hypothetical protein